MVDADCISCVSFSGKNGTIITLRGYMSTMFTLSDVILDSDIRKLGRILEEIPHLSAKEYRGDMRKAEYLPKAAVEQGVSVSLDGDMVEISLPGLLPRKKAKTNHEFWLDPLNRRHDYDNLETKQVLDVVATFLLVDDSGMCCDTYHTAETGEKNGTRILVMPKERFPAWIAEKQVR